MLSLILISDKQQIILALGCPRYCILIFKKKTVHFLSEITKIYLDTVFVLFC